MAWADAGQAAAVSCSTSGRCCILLWPAFAAARDCMVWLNIGLEDCRAHAVPNLARPALSQNKTNRHPPCPQMGR